MSAISAAHAGQKIAVIGSGISGLSCAWLLAQHSGGAYDVTLFEADNRIGGHTNTVDVELAGVRHGVDTGFLVFNDWTYPNLIALFAHLNIDTAASEMSFSVSLRQAEKVKLEWSGCNLATVFAQPSNLVSPKFLGMLRDLLRFNKQTTALVNANAALGGTLDGTLGDFLDANEYGQAFRDWYLRPMAACIWSTPSKKINDFPLQSFLTFCKNHGLISISNRPQWRTVRGGAKHYADKLVAQIPNLRCNAKIKSVRAATENSKAIVVLSDGEAQFDHVVMACHSDETLALLANATPAQQRILGAIKYHPNVAVLHTDTRLLPERKRAWAAWNYLAPYDAAAGDVSLSYLINRLQPLPFKQAVVVTLNPPFEPDDKKVLARINYTHPVYLAESVAAQRDLPEIQGANGLWFAGAWTRYGFHEDGLRSGIAVALALGATLPWQSDVVAANKLGSKIVPLRESMGSYGH